MSREIGKGCFCIECWWFCCGTKPSVPSSLIVDLSCWISRRRRRHSFSACWRSWKMKKSKMLKFSLIEKWSTLTEFFRSNLTCSSWLLESVRSSWKRNFWRRFDFLVENFRSNRRRSGALFERECFLLLEQIFFFPSVAFWKQRIEKFFSSKRKDENLFFSERRFVREFAAFAERWRCAFARVPNVFLLNLRADSTISLLKKESKRFFLFVEKFFVSNFLELRFVRRDFLGLFGASNSRPLSEVDRSQLQPLWNEKVPRKDRSVRNNFDASKRFSTNLTKKNFSSDRLRAFRINRNQILCFPLSNNKTLAFLSKNFLWKTKKIDKKFFFSKKREKHF